MGPHEERDGYAFARFEALFRENADTVLAYATRRSDPDTAQEIVAETFAVAWRRLDVVPDPALPWLLGGRGTSSRTSGVLEGGLKR